jgi:hypothetical protein
MWVITFVLLDNSENGHVHSESEITVVFTPFDYD